MRFIKPEQPQIKGISNCKLALLAILAGASFAVTNTVIYFGLMYLFEIGIL